MIKKLDFLIDKAMEKSWVRVVFFTLMIINAIVAVLGAIVLAVVV